MVNKKLLLFLIAAFSLTQIKVVGYIGISELVLLLVGPFVLYINRQNLKRDGFMPFLVLAGLWMISALITDWYRQNSLNNTLRGVASPLSVLLMTPCIYWLLKDNVRNVKWAVLGFTVTMFLSTYVIQSGTSYGYAEQQGISALEAAEEYKLTRVALMLSVGSLVPILAYLKIPTLSVLITTGMAFYGLYEGGRSTFLGFLVSAGMLFVVNGYRSRIARISRIFPIMIVTLLALVFAAKEVYVFVVTHGYMGDAELKKYEMQTATKIGVMGGRSQFVPVFFAVCDSPILGHGSWALDYQGYALRAAEWLNDDVAIDAYWHQPGVELIPGHSHIFNAFVWHGVFGAVFWLYVLYILWQMFRFHLGVVPELYGYLALTLPSLIWAILFSPFGGRVSTTTAIVVCLLLRNMRSRGRAFVPVMVSRLD